MIVSCESLCNARRIMWLTITIICMMLQSCSPVQEVMSCAIEYKSKQFDFSGLSWSPWKVNDVQNTSLEYASISLCNNTHQTPCGVVSVCVIGKNNSRWSSVGTTLQVQEKEDYGNFKVTAILQEINTVVPSVITAEIKLICVDKMGGPDFVKFENKRIYLTWETAAACPVKDPTSYKNCIFDDVHMGKINIQPLRHLLYYTTTDNKGSRYYVNICGGGVSGSVCGNVEKVAACEIDSENRTHILGITSKQQVVKTGGLSLQFRNKGKKTILKVELICNSSVQHGQLKFKSENNTMHIFELETSYACVLELVDCSVRDKDNFKYDLSKFCNMSDVVYNKGKIKYILSVCRSVKNSLCPVGSSVCLLNGTSSLSLGSLGDGPEINDDELSITSTGGSYCNVSNFRYRSVIVFKCSKTDKPPNLVRVTPECVHIFNWYTAAACPLVSAVGSNCRVHDPVYAHDFNLTSLRKFNEDYLIIDENSGVKFDLNVCGELSKPCNGSTDVGVCLTDRKGRQYPIGNLAVAPHYDDGRLSFLLTGKGCESNTKSSTVHIIFLCSHNVEGINSHPEYLVRHEDCSYFFVWRTVIACAKFVVHDCVVSDDKGEKYDLTPLSLPDEDYIIMLNGTNGYRKFIINVCRPVIFGHESRCPSQSGICLQDMTEPNYQKSFTSVGEASGLQYDSEKKMLKVEYKGGAICKNGADTEISGVIIFVCDKKGNESSRPTFVRESGCRYEFEWKTNLACSKEEESDLQDSGCMLHNSDSNIVLDFNSLADYEQRVKSSAGEVFRLAICSSLKAVNTQGVGICREAEGDCENVGMENRDLLYEKGRLYLNYTNGVSCTANGRKYTIIEFICDMKDEKLEVVTSLNLCEYIVTWRTNFACVVPCVTDGPKKINLSLLSSGENNYETTVNGTDYFISVCKPLVPKEGLNCHHGTAVCKAVNLSPGSSWSDEMALGYSHYRPVFLGSNVVLNYSSNVPCPNNASQNLGSSVILMCDPLAALGHPVLNHIRSDCQYEFLWNTSVVCDDYIIKFSDTNADRMLKNNQSNTFINLQPLCRKTKYQVGNYLISMCNSHYLCVVEKVEKQKAISYGRAEYAVFSYSKNVTKLFISGGDQCGAELSVFNAVIVLMCSTKAGDHIHILKQSDCSVEFEWKTNAACSQLIVPTETDFSMTTVTKSHASTVGILLGIGLTVIVCLIVYFLNKSTIRNWCRRTMNRFFSRRHQGEFHYTLVSTFYAKEL